jgi:AAA family ATP:ADP antiporter
MVRPGVRRMPRPVRLTHRVAREAKYKAKQAIDTFFVRFGDVLSAGLVFAGTTWFAFSPKHFAMVNVGLVLVWLGLAVALGRMFRERSGGEA